MAQGNPTVLKIRTEIENLQGLNQLKTAVRRISAEAKSADNDFGRLTGQIKELQSATVKSINNLEAQRQAFQALRRSVDVTSKEFKNATEEIKKLDQQLAKAEGRKAGGGRLRAGAQIAGTIAGAGVFGGPEGAIGAAIGAVGGVPGAIVGGAIGAQVAGIRQALGAVAEYSAGLEKLRVALRGVTSNQVEYEAALAVVNRTTKEFAIPQSLVTRQFTRLQASVQGAGGNVRDTETAFKGIVSAVRATGGSLSDVDAALTATAQVFSKGKVSAEELRQQIGERLPGAFTVFAESIGKTPQELDKALEDGKITLQDFQVFAEELFKRYGETAQEIADGPASAGDRLKVALENLQEAIGPTLAEIGRKFQEFATFVIEKLTPVAGLINRLTGQDLAGKTARLAALEQKILPRAEVQARRFLVSEGTSMQLALEYQDYLQGLRDERDRLRKELDQGQVQEQESIPESRLSSTATTAGAGNADKEAERQAKKIAAAEAKAVELGEKLRRMLRDVAFEFKGIGASAEEAIYLKASEAINAAIDQEEDLLKQIDELSRVTGNPYEKLREAAMEYAASLVTVAEKQRDLALQEESNKRFAALLKGYGFSGEVDVSGKMLGAMTPQEFPTGVDSILQPNQLKQNIEELRTSLQALVDPVNQITSAATTIGDAFAQSFTSAISGASTAKEALASFFQSVGSYFLDMANQIIAKMITMAILNSVARVLPGLGSNAGSGFNLTGFGNLQSDAGSGIPGFLAGADGILPRANGGAVNANQPYIVGERGPELFMPSSSGMVMSNENLQAQNRAFLDSIDTENGGTASDDSETEREATVATRAAIRESERIQENRMQIMSQQKEFDRRYERERIEQMASTPGKLNIKYESQVINNVEYVTREQAERMAAQSALRGRELAIGSLQNSVKTRKRVGIS